MPRIDIEVKDRYDGAGLRRSSEDVRNLTRDVQRLQEASGSGTGIATVAQQITAQVEALGGVQRVAVQSVAQAGATMRGGANPQAIAQSATSTIINMGNAATATSRKVAELRRELEAINHLQRGTSAGFREAQKLMGTDAQGTLMLQGKAGNPAYVQGLRDQIAEHEASEQQRALNYRLRLVRNSTGLWERTQREMESEETRSTQWKMRLMRRSQADWDRQQNREAAAQRAQERAAIAAEKRAEGEFRRGNFDSYLAAGVLGGVSAAAFMPLKYGTEKFGESQMARVGLSAFGGDVDQGVAQAKTDAKDVFGAGYVDILKYQSMLRNASESGDEARRSVLALSDAVAATGGNADKLERVVHNLAQVDNQAKLSARDLRDFEVNLIPATQLISRGLGIDPSELRKKMAAGEISGVEARKALISEIEKDPRFAGRGKAITQGTLPGQIEKFQENAAQTAEMAGATVVPSVGKLLEVANASLGFLQAHPTLTAGLTYATAGLGVLSGAGAGIYGARAGLGTLGQAMPGLQNLPVVGGAFGGSPMDRAAVNLDDAARNLNMASGRIGSGGGGGVTGGLPGTASAGLPSVTSAAAVPWYARAVAGGAIPTLPGALGGAGSLTGALTWGGAAASAGLGAVGGIQSYGELKAAGYSAGESLAAAAGIGITETLVSAFVPGGAIAVALAEGLKFGIDQTYNRPMEEDAENNLGTQLSEEQAKKGPQTWQQKADAAKARAEKLQFAADDYKQNSWDYDPNIWRGKEAEAESARQDWRTASRHARHDANPQVRQQKELDDWMKGEWDRSIGQKQSAAITNRPQESVHAVKHNPDMSQTITLTLPPHPQVKGTVDDINAYTRPG